MSLFALVSFISIILVCKDGNTTYKPGDKFIKNDCSQNCTCFDDFVGYTECSSLCATKPLKKCPSGFKVEEHGDPINGTNCFCNRSSCVKRK